MPAINIENLFSGERISSPILSSRSLLPACHYKIKPDLTNSAFSRKAIRKAFADVQPYVLYPPADTERFSHAYSQSINAREVKVLVVAHFSPEK